jgi:hypothetical protein
VVGVRKRADNNGGQSEKRSHEAAQRQVQRTQEVEERSRWRWSLQISAYIGIRTGLSLHRGPATFGRAPFLCMASAANERIGVVGDVRHGVVRAPTFPARCPATPTICAIDYRRPVSTAPGRSRPATSGLGVCAGLAVANIRTGKQTGLGRLPSASIEINRAWCVAATIAAGLRRG